MNSNLTISLLEGWPEFGILASIMIFVIGATSFVLKNVTLI